MSQVLQQQPWFRRVGGSVKGAIIGVFLFLVSIPLLFWNERGVVKSTQALRDPVTSVVSLPKADLDPENEGRLVRVSGFATTDTELTDEQFGVSVNAIRLNRQVEMFQWHEDSETETRTKPGGGTESVKTFSYQEDWFGSLIDSSKFQDTAAHQNPVQMPFEQRVCTSAEVMLGAFRLPDPLVEKILGSVPLSVSLADVPVDLKRSLGKYRPDDPEGGFSWSRWGVSQEPQIGDVRITFAYTPTPTRVSVLAQQVGSTFQPFTTKDGRKLCLLSMGELTADGMTTEPEAKSRNATLTWLLRLVGGLMMFGSISLILRPLSEVADLLPPIDDLIGIGQGLVAALVAAALSLITIGSAWVFYRPLIGVPLLALAVVLIVLLSRQVQARISAKRIGLAVIPGAAENEAEVVEETLGV